MSYAYYPGCSARGTGRSYEESLLAVFEALGAGLDALDDWNCCGATAYPAVDEVKGLALSAQFRACRGCQSWHGTGRSGRPVRWLLPGSAEERTRSR